MEKLSFFMICPSRWHKSSTVNYLYILLLLCIIIIVTWWCEINLEMWWNRVGASLSSTTFFLLMTCFVNNINRNCVCSSPSYSNALRAKKLYVWINKQYFFLDLKMTFFSFVFKAPSFHFQICEKGTSEQAKYVNAGRIYKN